jgi:hypothetical protein
VGPAADESAFQKDSRRAGAEDDLLATSSKRKL